MGVLANHFQPGMLYPLKRALPNARFIATSVPGAPNSMAPRDLVRAWGRNSRAIADTDEAFADAASHARGTLIVCGSLYLVGYVRNKII
jgi:folylpolyglutamate synthase/dihydropteroate synthase